MVFVAVEFVLLVLSQKWDFFDDCLVQIVEKIDFCWFLCGQYCFHFECYCWRMFFVCCSLHLPPLERYVRVGVHDYWNVNVIWWSQLFWVFRYETVYFDWLPLSLRFLCKLIHLLVELWLQGYWYRSILIYLISKLHLFITLNEFTFESKVVLTLAQINRQRHNRIFDCDLNLFENYRLIRTGNRSHVQFFTVLELSFWE